MAGHLDIHAPGPFNVIGENTNLSKSWEQYVKRFEYYLKATGINKTPKRKLSCYMYLGTKYRTFMKLFRNMA